MATSPNGGDRVTLGATSDDVATQERLQRFLADDDQDLREGRAGIHEFLVVDSTLRRAIHEDKDEMSIETQLFKQAYSLRENGLMKVISGITSLEEVMRVTAERGGDA